MATRLDHQHEASRLQSRDTRSNPLVSKCDFLLITIPRVELSRTGSSFSFSLWAVCLGVLEKEGGGVLGASAAPLGGHAFARAGK